MAIGCLVFVLLKQTITNKTLRPLGQQKSVQRTRGRKVEFYVQRGLSDSPKLACGIWIAARVCCMQTGSA